MLWWEIQERRLKAVAVDLEFLSKSYFYFDEPVPYQLDNNYTLYIKPISVRNSQFFLDSVDLLTIDKNSSSNPQIIQMSYLQFITDVLLQSENMKVYKQQFINLKSEKIL